MEPYRDHDRDSDLHGWGGPDDGRLNLDKQGADDRGDLGDGRDTPAGGRGKTLPKRARTGLVTLVAFVLELIVVAGLGNQAVTKQVLNRTDDIHTPDRLVRTVLTYSWRFSPQGGSDNGHVWLAELVVVLAFLVISTLLIIPAVHGHVTFWRAFFGVWGAVVLGTVLARAAGAAIVDPSVSKETRVNNILFNSSTSDSVTASVGFGLVLALITAIVAVSSRRAPAVAAIPAAAPEPDNTPSPEAPAPFYGDPTAFDRTSEFERQPSDTDTAATTQFHRHPDLDRGRGNGDAPSASERTTDFSGFTGAVGAAGAGGVVGAAAPEGARRSSDEQTDASSESEDARSETRQFPVVTTGGESAPSGPAAEREPGIRPRPDVDRDAPSASDINSGAGAAEPARSAEPPAVADPAAAVEPAALAEPAAPAEPAHRAEHAEPAGHAPSEDQAAPRSDGATSVFARPSSDDEPASAPPAPDDPSSTTQFPRISESSPDPSSTTQFPRIPEASGDETAPPPPPPFDPEPADPETTDPEPSAAESRTVPQPVRPFDPAAGHGGGFPVAPDSEDEGLLDDRELPRTDRPDGSEG